MCVGLNVWSECVGTEDAVKQGYDKIPIRTVDTDVVVLAVTSAQRRTVDCIWCS